MAGPASRSYGTRGAPPNGKGKLSERSTAIFRLFSLGLAEEAILASNPAVSRADIIMAAREALILNQVVHARDQRVEKVLRQYPRAFDKWTPDEEKRVAEMYGAGKTMREIAAQVQRQPNAIKNRLERIGLFKCVDGASNSDRSATLLS